MELYKKLGDCFKILQKYREALYYYKKQLRLSWYLSHNLQRKLENHLNEFNAYDNIGLMHYYLGNIDKAIYYHNRMMNGEAERRTLAKNLNLQSLNKDGELFRIRQHMLRITIFQQYKTTNRYLHEDNEEKKKLNTKLQTIGSKQLLISPKYEKIDIKETLLKKALQNILEESNTSTKISSLQELSKDFITTTNKFRYTIAPLEFQYKLERQKKILSNNSRVASMTCR